MEERDGVVIFDFPEGLEKVSGKKSIDSDRLIPPSPEDSGVAELLLLLVVEEAEEDLVEVAMELPGVVEERSAEFVRIVGESSGSLVEEEEEESAPGPAEEEMVTS